MSCGVSASPSPPNYCSPPFTPETSRYFSASCSLIPRTLSSTDLKLRGLRFSGAQGPQTIIICCNSSTRPGGPGSGDTDSRSVLDAFFLGKALAEALSERIESSVGEFLSTIGRLQAEQQKQVQDFQEDVLERAKRAKEKAALEAIEARGLVSKATTENTTPATAENTTPATDAVNSVMSPSVTSEITPATPSVQSDPDAAEKEESID